MNYSDDIFARLQAGETVEEIAAALTNSINEANEKFAAAKAKEEYERAQKAAAAKLEAEAKKRATDQAKHAAVENLLDSVCDVFDAWGIEGDIAEELACFTDEDVDEFVDVIDQTLPFLLKYLDMQMSIQKLVQKTERNEPDLAKVKKEPSTDPVQDFLNQFVRFK